MEIPRDRIAAACHHSQFKDDRHDWVLLMHEGSGYVPYRDVPLYELRQCKCCKLTVLLRTVDGGPYASAPKKEDEIIYSFFAMENR